MNITRNVQVQVTTRSKADAIAHAMRVVPVPVSDNGTWVKDGARVINTRGTLHTVNVTLSFQSK